MEPIKITVTGADARVQKKSLLTCGMVGVPVEFTFDESWQGLQKTAVFRVGMTTLDVLNLDTACVVPHELLLTPYRTLRIGVYGCAADGSLVIPTVWADAGQILPGADPSGDASAEPTLPVWQQIQKDMVKSVNGVKPDENGDVQIPTGGGSGEREPGGVLTVTVINDIASHTPAEMLDWVCNGGSVIINSPWGLLSAARITGVHANFFGFIDDSGFCVNWVVYEDGSVEGFEHNLVTLGLLEQTVGDISAALDHIIELQEELIGV